MYFIFTFSWKTLIWLCIKFHNSYFNPPTTSCSHTISQCYQWNEYFWLCRIMWYVCIGVSLSFYLLCIDISKDFSVSILTLYFNGNNFSKLLTGAFRSPPTASLCVLTLRGNQPPARSCQPVLRSGRTVGSNFFLPLGKLCWLLFLFTFNGNDNVFKV